ncbi:DUF3426 domain-containing protein [Pseudoxanthomonas sp. PXM02]|uniref:DUF3426 domain-containing protein n=1 Tax=Pseudoxanthomonas sp. PXM02 TaxID=2769294 RepID=UPI00177BBB52|nr:DUF3426 domain-containing protein [Pseudoxanthomonas sp. PXM02]MBD9478936.1 DUF3426 domain-containing protein [Pseudoxanthomonas sp. PXM02]
MFTACPHCQFLVARDPHSGATPTECPRCGKPLATGGDTTTPAPSLATLLHAAPVDNEAESTAAKKVEADVVETQAVDDAAMETPSVAALTETPSPLADAPDADTADKNDAGVQTGETVASEATAAATPAPDVTSPPVIEAPVVVAPPPARKATGPRFLHGARTTPVHTRRARLQWTIAGALSLLLCIQVVIADRARLAMQAGWRPVVTALCGVFRCDVPTWREPAAFTMLSRDVRPLLDMPGTLQAQATFRNESRWAQAWPVILLTLKDADGRTLGARALQPTDYLPEGETATAIGPGQSAQMAVRIREPSASVVAFSFDFR